MDKFSQESPGLFARVDGYARECIQYNGDDELDYSIINFSELCTFLEYIELREYGGGERWKNEGSREKLALRFYLAKTIVERTPATHSIPKIYLDFVSQLHEGDIVISFNWDCLLEVALNKIGKAYTYNWKDDKAIKISKMHGSVNWRLNEPKYQKITDWESMNFTEGMMDVEIFHSPSLLDYDTWHNFSSLSEIEPFLVLPGYGKAFDVRSNAILWYKPEFAFGFTHDVYIIGLSLAHDDFFIRSLFLSNLPYIENFSGDTGRKIFIITPDPKAVENYKFVLSKGHAELIHEKFSIKHVELMKNRIKNI